MLRWPNMHMSIKYDYFLWIFHETKKILSISVQIRWLQAHEKKKIFLRIILFLIAIQCPHRQNINNYNQTKKIYFNLLRNSKSSIYSWCNLIQRFKFWETWIILKWYNTSEAYIISCIPVMIYIIRLFFFRRLAWPSINVNVNEFAHIRYIDTWNHIWFIFIFFGYFYYCLVFEF